MTKTILRRHHRGEALVPVATKTPPATSAAPHLSARADRDRHISFDDFDPEADFTGMPHDWTPARGGDQLNHAATVSALAQLRADDIAWLPASVGLRVVPLPDADPLEQLFAMLDEPGSWPPVAYDLARSVTVSDQLAQRPAHPRIDLRDLDGYIALAEHENAIASIQSNIYADRANVPAESGPLTVADLPDWIADNLRKSHGKFLVAMHYTDTDGHLTSIEPGVAVVADTGETAHFCHFCDDVREYDNAFPAASAVSIVTLDEVTAL